MPPIQGFRLIVLTIAVSLGLFMNILDTSVANVAIPTIVGDMGVSRDQGTWIITAFMVSLAIVLPITGWLARRFGEVRLFILSTSLFTVASILCGLSTNLSMLVFFRVIQGAVAGPMIPLSQSLLLANYPSDKKGLATALWAMTAVVAPTFGPVLGGYITDNFSWSWIFYINIPVGIVSVYLTWSILRNRETKITKSPIDFVGLILLVIGVGSLQILLDKGKDLDWFDSPFINFLTVSSVISLSFLMIWELTEKHPVVDLMLFKGRNFTVGTTAISLGYMIFFGSVVILPLWLQTEMNYTPTWAGLVTSPFGVLAVIVSPFIGRLMNIIDLRILVSFGFFVFVVCSFWFSGFDTNIRADDVAFLRFIQGLGVPFFFIQTTAILLAGLPDKQLASAAGLSNFFRILAGSFGVSISVTLWDHREAIHQSKLVESLSSYNAAFQASVEQLKHLGFTDPASYAAINNVVTTQAYMLATNDIFWLSGYLFLGLLGFIWLARPPFLIRAGAAGAAH